MYLKHKNSTKEKIYEIEVNIPPVVEKPSGRTGMVYNYMERKWEEREIYKRSEDRSEQLWEIPKPPFNYSKEAAIEKRRQRTEPLYVDVKLEEWRISEWDRRINGFWFYNNGVPTYITGLNYFYLTQWTIDGSPPDYRWTDRRWFLLWRYCEEDPLSLGMIESAARRTGKTEKSMCMLTDYGTRKKFVNLGIQSKTDEDAAFVMEKLIRSYVNIAPFYKPILNTQGKKVPTNALNFVAKDMNEDGTHDGLNTSITFRSSKMDAYDGYKMGRYVRDECFDPETKVLMSDYSVRPIKDIRYGDYVMGDDYTPRFVHYRIEGFDTMYEVKTSKGEGFTCNSEHKLVMKWARRDYPLHGKYYFGDEVEMSVKEYLNLTPSQKKHLVMFFSNGSNSGEDINLPIDPRTLGMWIGDGSRCDGSICGVDKEVGDYLNSKYKEVKHRESERKNGPISFWTPKGLRGDLKNTGLYKNKHIPELYFKSSRKQRLELLAGLLDTDGSLNIKDGKPRSFEITQKLKHISEGVYKLAKSLGFYASLNTKTARMKREDGSIYECEVYRIAIYGDLYKIPTLISRKKAQKVEFNNNRRNPLNNGFTVTELGNGKYIGITIDGNNRFLLADSLVVHNCGKVKHDSVFYGWQVLKPTFLVGSKTVVGKALYTTTIEEGGSEAYKALWTASNPEDLNPVGQTESGMYRLFTPAYMNDADFLDKHGNPMIEEAKEHQQKIRDSLMHDSRLYGEYVRKYPWTIKEAFFSINDEAIFDSFKINQQIDSLGYKEEEDWVQVGNFQWEERDQKVKFVPNKNGKFKIHGKVDVNNDMVWNAVNTTGPKPIPLNTLSMVAGSDPFDHKIQDIEDKKRASKGTGYVFHKFDGLNSEMSETFLCEYKSRPPDPDIYYEDMIMMCFFFGCKMLTERNKSGIVNYFDRRGYNTWLIKDQKGHRGINAGIENKQWLAEATDSYIAKNCHKVVFFDLLYDWNIFDLTDSRKNDCTMGAGWALVAAYRIDKKLLKNDPTDEKPKKDQDIPASDDDLTLDDLMYF